jgi:hypothetical protein
MKRADMLEIVLEEIRGCLPMDKPPVHEDVTVYDIMTTLESYGMTRDGNSGRAEDLLKNALGNRTPLNEVSKRDQIALSLVSILIQRKGKFQWGGNGFTMGADSVANAAYTLADAMIARSRVDNPIIDFTTKIMDILEVDGSSEAIGVLLEWKKNAQTMGNG